MSVSVLVNCPVAVHIMNVHQTVSTETCTAVTTRNIQ